MPEAPATSAAETVRKFEAAIMEKGDFDLAMNHAHPDFTIREAKSLPYGGTYVGRAGLDELMEEVARYWEFLDQPTISIFDVSESLAASRVEGRARLRQTGEEVDFLVTEWFTVRDGKVADVEAFYFDQKPLLAAAAAEREGESA
jgi:ketosteroid isomerase-like protein